MAGSPGASLVMDTGLVSSESSTARCVQPGKAYFDEIMRLDRVKSEMTKADLEGALTHLVQQFVEESALDLDVTISFCDVHELMKRQHHTELAYVQLDGRHCRLLFHDRLITFQDQYSGLVFVAKSWVLLMVIGEMNRSLGEVKKDFVFEIGDSGSLDQVSFSSNHKDACLILDDQFASTNGYAEFRETCESRMVPWHERASKAFWRGSTTGSRVGTPPGEGEPDDLRWLPRLHLSKIALDSEASGKFDIGISSIVQMSEDYLVERIRQSGVMKPPTPREEFFRYKAVIDIDGNANAWSGLFCSLLGASCVIKVASQRGFHQWYYKDLKPWLHYIPVEGDMSDLVDAVNWILQHDAHAVEIAKRGRDFSLNLNLGAAVAQSAVNLFELCQDASS